MLIPTLTIKKNDAISVSFILDDIYIKPSDFFLLFKYFREYTFIKAILSKLSTIHLMSTFWHVRNLFHVIPLAVSADALSNAAKKK